jgi:hypothetical protein
VEGIDNKKDHLNWQEEFEGFPRIPKVKIWNKGQAPGEATEEQIILQKLMQNKSLSGAEINLLVDCTQFYKALYKKLVNFDYTRLMEKNCAGAFLGYIGYAFNFTLMISEQYEIPQTFRMVKNKNGVSKSTIDNISFAPLKVVQELGVYNRASSPKSTVFYSCETINTCFLELKPSEGEIVTLARWEATSKDKIICYPIPEGSIVSGANKFAYSSLKALTNIRKKWPPLLARHLEGFFEVLRYEYSKKVNQPLEYLISAYFSENIFSQGESNDTNFDYGGIVYPSVASGYHSTNLALKPEVVKSHFRPTKVYELEIIKTFYDAPQKAKDPQDLTAAKVRLIKQANTFTDEGQILWS